MDMQGPPGYYGVTKQEDLPSPPAPQQHNGGGVEGQPGIPPPTGDYPPTQPTLAENRYSDINLLLDQARIGAFFVLNLYIILIDAYFFERKDLRSFEISVCSFISYVNSK